MFPNYLRSTFRLLAKEKFYVFLNAFGLAVGMAASFLIFTWVRAELGFDQSYPAADRLYRVVTDFDGQSEPGMATTYPMVRTRVLNQFPEVEASARLFNQGFLGSKTRVAREDKVLTNLRFYYGDAEVLTLFGFPVVAGNASTALTRPNPVVLTRATAEKLFGEEDPLGKTIRIGSGQDVEVTAIIENMPENAHFHFDLLASMLSHPWIRSAEDNLWSGIVFHTYVKLRPGASAQALQANIARVLDNFPDDPKHFGRDLDLQLQAVTDIHLKSNRKFEAETNGSATYVYLFVSIAVLVLAVAMINYINLATARHTQRYLEVGVRKALGAQRRQLIMQFLSESLMVTLLAFVGAVLLAETARPLLAGLSGKNLTGGSFFDPEVLVVTGGVAFLIGLVTGALPAWALSSFRPALLFRPASIRSNRRWNVRSLLMVLQFGVSILLTLCTAITYLQMNYLQDASLGYRKDHTLVLDISLPGARENFRALKNEFSNVPGVEGVTAASQLPTDIQTGENIDLSPSLSHGVYCISVDPDFFRVMSIPLKTVGDPLATLQPNDTVNHFVLNSSALAAVGWSNEEAIGREISIRHGNQKPGPVLGVSEDFHFQSLHHAIGPLAIEFNPGSYQYLLVRIAPERVQATLEALSESWGKLSGGIPFDYQFLDEQYNRLYQAEQRSGGLFLAFSAIALFISQLGLFGLASFTLERRTKEMGLRKILGAGAWRIAALVTKDFLFLMLIAFALALPLGFWFRDSWLSQFAFRAEVGIGIFALCGLLIASLALLTILYHTAKISRVNPVETLRYE